MTFAHKDTMKTVLTISAKVVPIMLAGNAVQVVSVRAAVLPLILESSMQVPRTVILWKVITMLVEAILWLSLAFPIARHARTQSHALFAILTMHLMVLISVLARSTVQSFKIVSYAQWQVAARTAPWVTISLTQQLATQFVATESKLPLKPVTMETTKMEMDAAPTAP